jgi:uncharacterized membrane protein YqjE
MLLQPYTFTVMWDLDWMFEECPRLLSGRSVTLITGENRGIWKLRRRIKDTAMQVTIY